MAAAIAVRPYAAPQLPDFRDQHFTAHLLQVVVHDFLRRSGGGF